jgi:hypothetical protein
VIFFAFRAKTAQSASNSVESQSFIGDIAISPGPRGGANPRESRFEIEKNDLCSGVVVEGDVEGSGVSPSGPFGARLGQNVRGSAAADRRSRGSGQKSALAVGLFSFERGRDCLPRPGVASLPPC